MSDLSDKGEKEFYKKWFEETESMIEKYSKSDSSLDKVISYKLTQLKSYMHQKEMYEKQLEIFWDTKKNHLIQCQREKEKYNGSISLKSQEIEKKLENHESYLKKMSSSFENDLEKIIDSDKDVNNLHLSPN